MNHINLDKLPKPVQQFIRGLAAGPGGTVIERNGEPLACIMPVPKPPARPTADTEWTETKNHRRCELIDRELDGTLTLAEKAELEGLQRELERYVERVAPLPLEPLRKLHQNLMKKAARSRAATS